MSIYDYLRNSEGNYYMDYEDDTIDFSNPSYINYRITPPTIIKYTINVSKDDLKEAYQDQIEEIIRRLLGEATDETVETVKTQVLAILDVSIEGSIEEKVRAAMESLDVITEEDLDEIIQ